MKIHRATTIRASVSIFVILLVATLFLYTLYNVFSHIETEVQSGTAWFTKDAVFELQKTATGLIDSGMVAGINGPELFEAITPELDKRFGTVLSRYENLQGGLYIAKGKKFYAVRTSKVNRMNDTDILAQFRDDISISNGLSLTKATMLHRIVDKDNLVFHISTAPVITREGMECSVWAVMRIEQMLPTSKLSYLLIVIVVLSSGGIVFAVIISYLLRLSVEEVKLGLLKQQMDTSFRLRKRKGILGAIVDSVNEVADKREIAEKQKEELWMELGKKDKLAALGKLLAGVAHEIKTPLAIMKTRVQLWQRKLVNGNDPADFVTLPAMTQLVNEIDRLSIITKKLLLFSKAKMGDLVPVNIRGALIKVIDLFSERNAEAGITIILDPDGYYPHVLCDPVGLEHIFINLISNAAEAMPGGGTISITAAKNSIDESMVMVKVTDEGPGIPEDIRSKLFDPFFSTKETGTGLGLAIAFEIADAFGGKLSLGNSDENGSEFMVKLKTTEIS